MGDDNEGDVPIQGRWCACGLLGREDTSHCPRCGRSWPEQLRTRYPHDGGPPLTRDPCSPLPEEMIVKTCEECGAVEGTLHDVGCRVYRHEQSFMEAC